MRKKKKEFSVLKWVIFPLNSVTLAAIVVWFNLSVFGYRDGVPYAGIVCLIGVFSIIINSYTESDNRSLAKAAFIFEIVLTAALIINACYSVSVQRKMSVARMAENSQAQTIGEISKLRGSRTQREALQKIDKPVAAQSVFADVETILFWIMVGELGLYGLSAFTLFAIAKLVDDDEAEEEFPEEIYVSNRSSKPAPKMTTRSDTVSSKRDDTDEQQKTTRVVNREGLKRLREVLKEIAFAAGKTHFKADPKPDIGAIWIRQYKSSHGVAREIAGVKSKLDILDDAMAMDRDAFRERLERFLIENEFEI